MILENFIDVKVMITMIVDHVDLDYEVIIMNLLIWTMERWL